MWFDSRIDGNGCQSSLRWLHTISLYLILTGTISSYVLLGLSKIHLVFKYRLVLLNDISCIQFAILSCYFNSEYQSLIFITYLHIYSSYRRKYTILHTLKCTLISVTLKVYYPWTVILNVIFATACARCSEKNKQCISLWSSHMCWDRNTYWA